MYVEAHFRRPPHGALACAEQQNMPRRLTGPIPRHEKGTGSARRGARIQVAERSRLRSAGATSTYTAPEHYVLQQRVTLRDLDPGATVCGS